MRQDVATSFTDCAARLADLGRHVPAPLLRSRARVAAGGNRGHAHLASGLRLAPDRRRGDQARLASIASITSGDSGSIRGRNLASTWPAWLTRNFSKFHWMSPASPTASGTAVSSA